MNTAVGVDWVVVAIRSNDVVSPLESVTLEGIVEREGLLATLGSMLLPRFTVPENPPRLDTLITYLVSIPGFVQRELLLTLIA